MSFLDIFALIILLVLLLSILAIWVVLAILPGRIARQRNHPQAAAINVCGWWGALTLGLLMPVAYIWAYTNPTECGGSDTATSSETKKTEDKQ